MTRSACCAADAQHMLAAVMDMYGLTSKPDIYADKDDTDKDADKDDADKDGTNKDGTDKDGPV